MIDEEKFKRLQKISKIIAFVSLGAFIVFLVFSILKLNQIHKDINKAEDELEDRKKQIAELDREIGNKNIQIEERNNTIRDTINELSGGVNKTAIRKVFEKNLDVAKSLPRIYVQLKREDLREPAKKLQKKLQAEGYIVPEIERIEDKRPQTKTELRYCNGKGQPSDVNNIIGFIKQSNQYIKDVSVIVLEDNCEKVGFRSYEIWLGDDFASPKKEDKQPINPKEVLVPKIDSRKLSNKKP